MTRKKMLQYSLRSVRYAGAKSWNSIPDVIKQSPSVSIFHRKLKSYIFSTNTKFKISLNNLQMNKMCGSSISLPIEGAPP